MQTLSEPSRETPLLGEWDIVVLGGGPAGIAAATAAGRAGRRTLLVERYGFLGGAGTASGVTNFCGLHATIYGAPRQVVHGIADELLARIAALGGLNAPHLAFGGRAMAQAYDTAALKIAADALLAAHRVELLFHALAVGVAMAGPSLVDALLVETKSGRRAIRAALFIDASGDGDLAAAAGALWDKGDAAGVMLYPSTMFRINAVEAGAALAALPSLPARMERAAAAGSRFPRKGAILRPQRNPLEWRANVTQLGNPDGSPVDGTDLWQLSFGEQEGRRQIAAVFAFLRAEMPGFGDSYIVDIPPQLGIRETRRIRGRYALTEADVLGCADFPDAIGVNGWPIEAHVAGDVVLQFPPIPESRGYNQLPYRMLLPLGLDNVLVAGRCASMTHEGQSAARVSGPCFVMGEAAGTAAALALAAGVAPAALETGRLQARLAANGAWLGEMATLPG